jgi:hypothetical protein
MTFNLPENNFPSEIWFTFLFPLWQNSQAIPIPGTLYAYCLFLHRFLSVVKFHRDVLCQRVLPFLRVTIKLTLVIWKLTAIELRLSWVIWSHCKVCDRFFGITVSSGPSFGLCDSSNKSLSVSFTSCLEGTSTEDFTYCAESGSTSFWSLTGMKEAQLPNHWSRETVCFLKRPFALSRPLPVDLEWPFPKPLGAQILLCPPFLQCHFLRCF